MATCCLLLSNEAFSFTFFLSPCTIFTSFTDISTPENNNFQICQVRFFFTEILIFCFHCCRHSVQLHTRDTYCIHHNFPCNLHMYLIHRLVIMPVSITLKIRNQLINQNCTFVIPDSAFDSLNVIASVTNIKIVAYFIFQF